MAAWSSVVWMFARAVPVPSGGVGLANGFMVSTSAETRFVR